MQVTSLYGWQRSLFSLAYPYILIGTFYDLQLFLNE